MQIWFELELLEQEFRINTFKRWKGKIVFLSIEWLKIVFIHKFPSILLIEVTTATPAQQKGRNVNEKGKSLRNVKSGSSLHGDTIALHSHDI